jgi:hypothetical protein
MSRVVQMAPARRTLLLGTIGLLVAACGDRTPPPPTPSAAPREPTLRTLADGRPVIVFNGLRYAVRPPIGWRIKGMSPRSEDGDIVVFAAPPDAPDPSIADTQISLEGFRKNERAPSIEAKIDNIRADRQRMRSDFSVERELPVQLANDRRAQIYVMRNVPSGDSEAVAFVDEGAVVAEMVLVTRTKGSFDQILPLFREMVRTYQRVP